MKALIIGGAGEMGYHACATVVGDPAVDELTIADRNAEAASELAERLGDKASPMALDVTDADALREAIGEADIVLNTVGPFHRWGLRVLEAAIDAGKSYVDINDDWQPTVDALELNERAAEAGITAIVGLGASPGISNMLAAVAMRELDRVDRVLTGWRTGGLPKPTPENPNPQATAAGEHWVHQCSNPIRVWRDGGYTEIDPLEELTITYPGLGTGPVFTCGHPEPITIPRARPEIRESLNVMVSRPGLMAALRRTVARVKSGELDVPAGVRALLIEPGIRGPAAGEPPPFPNLFALAEGTVDGQPMSVGVSGAALPVGGMGEITGIPLAIGAGMLVRGELAARGVFAPEAVIDPDLFFARMVPFSAAGKADQLYAVARFGTAAPSVS